MLRSPVLPRVPASQPYPAWNLYSLPRFCLLPALSPGPEEALCSPEWAEQGVVLSVLLTPPTGPLWAPAIEEVRVDGPVDVLPA